MKKNINETLHDEETMQQNHSVNLDDDETFNASEPEDLENLEKNPQNSVSLTLSWSLMNHVRSMARTEGISVEDLFIELISEGVTKRVFEDQMRPTPSHLLTRTGYVHNDESMGTPQPQLSAHSLRGGNNGQNRGKYGNHYNSRHENSGFNRGGNKNPRYRTNNNNYRKKDGK